MLKQFNLIVFGCFCSFFSFGQIKEGTIIANFKFGNLNTMSFSDKSSNYSNKNISYNPGIGYFIKKNWEIGAGINYNRVRNTSDAKRDFAQNSNTWGANVYTNYYFGKGKLKPYLTLQAGWESIRGSYYMFDIKNDINNNYFYYGIGGGLNYNISRRFALFTEATFRNYSPFSQHAQGQFNLTFGARYFFNRGKRH
jgi:Outer membrane protein beta-barrel domain